MLGEICIILDYIAYLRITSLAPSINIGRRHFIVGFLFQFEKFGFLFESILVKLEIQFFSKNEKKEKK